MKENVLLLSIYTMLFCANLKFSLPAFNAVLCLGESSKICYVYAVLFIAPVPASILHTLFY